MGLARSSLDKEVDRMPPPAANSSKQVLDLVLDRLDQIQKSLHELRDDVHNKFNSMSTRLATLEEWKEGHEKWARDELVRSRGEAEQDRAQLKAVATTQGEIRGALFFLKLIIAFIATAFAGVQAYLAAKK